MAFFAAGVPHLRFAAGTIGEIQITLTAVQPGFFEQLAGPGTERVGGHEAWLLDSQAAFADDVDTLFW